MLSDQQFMHALAARLMPKGMGKGYWEAPSAPKGAKAKGSGKGGWNLGKGAQPQCIKCGGHHSPKTCPMRPGGEKEHTCSKCGKVGHLEHKCLSDPGGKGNAEKGGEEPKREPGESEGRPRKP